MYVQHVDFDGLPPEEIPDLEETRLALFGPLEEEEQQQQQQEAAAAAAAAGEGSEWGIRRRPTGWVYRDRDNMPSHLLLSPSDAAAAAESSSIQQQQTDVAATIRKPTVLLEAEMHSLHGLFSPAAAADAALAAALAASVALAAAALALAAAAARRVWLSVLCIQNRLRFSLQLLRIPCRRTPR